MKYPQADRSESGIALLITIATITLLIAGTLEMNRLVRAAVIATASTRDQLVRREMARSGVNLAMALLIKDKSDSAVDSIQEDWANPDKIKALIGDIPFDAGTLNLEIQDELGKIQVNAIVDFPKGRHFNESQKILWDRLTRLLIDQAGDDERFKDLEATAIINAVKDWIDSGDDDATTGLNGAESDYYQGLTPPYPAANAPITDLSELTLIKGISGELYYGIGETNGMKNFLTVYGASRIDRIVDKRQFTYDGAININTAPLPVLMALVPSENPEYAKAIYDFRNEKEEDRFVHDLTSPTWYKNVSDIPSDMTIDPKLIRISSDIFRIISSARLNGMDTVINAVVEREQAAKTGQWTCKIINWESS